MKLLWPCILASGIPDWTFCRCFQRRSCAMRCQCCSTSQNRRGETIVSAPMPARRSNAASPVTNKSAWLASASPRTIASAASTFTLAGWALSATCVASLETKSTISAERTTGSSIFRARPSRAREARPSNDQVVVQQHEFEDLRTQSSRGERAHQDIRVKKDPPVNERTDPRLSAALAIGKPRSSSSRSGDIDGAIGNSWRCWMTLATSVVWTAM